ncbi:shikimate dehydrogenase [Chloroflexota bacterium]
MGCKRAGENLRDDNVMVNRSVPAKAGLCGIIGDPIEHSMSPPMHNAAFEKMGLDCLYLPFRVSKADLGKAIDGMRALNIVGLNVTIPHKVAVMQFLDELDPLAEKMGAVNTIVNNDGFLKGYNTDATGFLQALLEIGIDPGGKNVVIIGAGGAARGISFVLAERGSNMVILNRTVDRARECAGRISKLFKREASALELNRENQAAALSKAEILINATSVGMSPSIDETPVASDLLSPSLIVCDIVYNPIKTRLLREAERAGAKTVDGVDMLVWQGALAWEKWTGLKAPFEVMRGAVIEALQKHED